VVPNGFVDVKKEIKKKKGNYTSLQDTIISQKQEASNLSMKILV
jgi:hypothetical protein